MYKMKADGVVFYDPSSDNTALQVLSPMAEFELNKAGSLTFTLPPGNVAYNSMQRMKTLVTLEQDGEVIFRGRVSETTTNLYKEKEVYCEGDLSFLLDSAVRPYKYEGSAASLLYQLVAQHNAQVESYKQFALGSVTAASGEMLTEFTSDACADTLSEIKTMLLDPFGGYLRVRYSGGTRYLDYIESYSASSGQAIEFGVNLVDLEDRYESADVFSVLVPLGAYYTEPVEEESDVTEPSEGEGTTEGEEGTEGSESTEGSEEEGTEEEEIKWVKPVKIAGMTTIEEVNGGSDSIVDSSALAKYGRIVKAHRWDDVTDPQELLDKGNELMSRMKDARTLTFTALDMHVINTSVDSIRLGDYVRLVSSPHGISMTDICSAIGLDIEQPHNSVYTFGVPPVTLTDINADAARQAAYANSHFHRWLSETDTTFEVAIQNLDLIGHRMNSVEFRMDAAEAEILLRAKQSEVDILTNRIKDAEVRISGAEASIELFGGTIDEFGNRLDGALVDIDGLNKRIDAVVFDTDGKIAALELSLTEFEANAVLKADYEKDKSAMLTLISNNEESIAQLTAKHGEHVAAFEAYASDLETRVLLKAEYEKDKSAMLTLISNNEESIAQLTAKQGEDHAATLTLISNAEESIAALEAKYDENREADLKLITNAQESVATLEAKYDDQIAQLVVKADEQGSLIAAKADLILLEGYVKADELETSVLEVLQYANLSQADLDVGYLDASDAQIATLDSNSITTNTINGGTPATQEWVQDQGYATQAWVNNKDYVLTSSLPSILISYATKNWVTEQGYLTAVPSGYATQSWVEGKGYLTSVPSNYATQAWVFSQGYLTEIPSGYATQDWVAENFSKASITYKPTTIERYGSVSDNSIPVRALNASGTVLLTGTVDAGDVYEAGEDSVTLSAGEWSSNKMTVTASNGKTLEVDASSIYQSGAEFGMNYGYEFAIKNARLTLEGSIVTCEDASGNYTGPTLDISSNLTASYNSGYSDATPVHASHVASYNSADNEYALQVTVLSDDGTRHVFDMTEIDASAAYDAGYAAAVDSATITCEGTKAIVTFSDGSTKELDLTEYVKVTGEIRSITNTAANYMQAQGWANALINDIQVDYTTFSKSQYFAGLGQ